MSRTLENKAKSAGSRVDRGVYFWDNGLSRWKSKITRAARERRHVAPIFGAAHKGINRGGTRGGADGIFSRGEKKMPSCVPRA